jgi:hypothetical protein
MTVQTTTLVPESRHPLISPLSSSLSSSKLLDAKCRTGRKVSTVSGPREDCGPYIAEGSFDGRV